MSEDKINNTKEAIYKLSNINTFSDSERTIFRNSANAINYQQQEIDKLNNIIDEIYNQWKELSYSSIDYNCKYLDKIGELSKLKELKEDK